MPLLYVLRTYSKGMQMISFAEAVEASLLATDSPVVTDYDVYRAASTLMEKRVWDGVPIKRAPKEWDVPRTRNILRRLVARQTLAADRDFRSGVWRLVQATRAGTADEVACIADPFCYVSHLSAMQRYGLTDRSPEALHITKPSRPIWNAMRNAKIAAEVPERDIGDAESLLRHFGLNPILRRRPVVVHETKYPAKPTQIRGERTRIISIGETFVDMLAEPQLCGGIHHALDIWDQQALDWLDQIIEAVDATESKIVKVRAGYILSERLCLDLPRIKAWRTFAQRGGSRKLDPDAPYAPIFSEPWMLSLNV